MIQPLPWFDWFIREGLKELFEEINPITDSGKNYVFRFTSYTLDDPKFDKEECRARAMTYSAPMRIDTRLTIGDQYGPIKEAEVLMGYIPIMTEEGTFIVNGTAREVAAGGELLQDHCRTGVRRMARTIKERMAVCDVETMTAAKLIRYRPLAAAVQEFVEGH